MNNTGKTHGVWWVLHSSGGTENEKHKHIKNTVSTDGRYKQNKIENNGE